MSNRPAYPSSEKTTRHSHLVFFRLASLIDSGNKAKNPMIANKNNSPPSCLLTSKAISFLGHCYRK
ncbi:MAG TPA: hypothetical protein VFZ67_02120 [Nitrososphaera sp.]